MDGRSDGRRDVCQEGCVSGRKKEREVEMVGRVWKRRDREGWGGMGKEGRSSWKEGEVN